MTEQKKLGVVLRGGGTYCQGYLGVSETLREYGILPDMIFGTSAGALIGAYWANGVSVEEVTRSAESIELFTLSSPQSLLNGKLWDPKKLRYFLEQSGVPGNSDDDDSPPLYIKVTHHVSRDGEVITEGNLLDILTATMAHPRLLKPVIIDGKAYIDGCFSPETGVAHLRRMGADIVIVLQTNKPLSSQSRYLPDADMTIETKTTGYSYVDFPGGTRSIPENYDRAVALIPKIINLLES